VTGKLRKLATSLVLDVFWDCAWTGLKRVKFSYCLSSQHRNFSSPTDFKIEQLLNRLSYQGVQITVGNIKKCSTSIVFGSRSDFPQRSPRFALTYCCSQSSQIRRRCRNFHFKVFLADSRMATYRGVLITWLGVYLMSTIALFARRVSSRWLHLWSIIRIGITLKPPWTLWVNLWILQFLWLIQGHLIVLPLPSAPLGKSLHQ
jgi:hypothetical protein